MTVGASFFLAGAGGAVGTLILIRCMAALAPKVGLVDIPDQRKTHQGAVPLVGGIALVLAYLFIASFLLPSTGSFAVFSLAALLMLVVGALDDVHDLRPFVRLVAQLGVATLLVLVGDVRIASLGNLLGAGEVLLDPPAMFLFTVFCVVSLINGLNMIDGLDGLAGGVAMVTLGACAAAAMFLGATGAVAHIGLLLCCLGAFLLFHNLRTPLRGRLVFLGDAGSMALGLTLACMAIGLAAPRGEGETLYPIAAVWMLGLLVLDTIATVIRRLMRGRSPLSAGRDHLHHLLLELGFSVPQVVGMLLGGAALLAAAGVAGWRAQMPEYLMTYGFVALSLVYFVALLYGWRKVETRTARVVPLRLAAAGNDDVKGFEEEEFELRKLG